MVVSLTAIVGHNHRDNVRRASLERIRDIRFAHVKNFLNGDFRPEPDAR